VKRLRLPKKSEYLPKLHPTKKRTLKSNIFPKLQVKSHTTTFVASSVQMDIAITGSAVLIYSCFVALFPVLLKISRFFLIFFLFGAAVIA